MAIKTYNDSYLYKTKILKTQKDNPEKKANAAIKDFIVNSHRVVKTGNEFRGVLEEVKRSQRSSALSYVLMSNNVVLCVNDFEMPRAFKVFDAKDMKNNLTQTIFIDCTGLIEFKNGYYSCRKIDVLLAYLFDAMIYLLYRYNNNKLVDNSTITMAATESYVSMFDFIIDYLRINGFSANKTKISYLVGLFFIHNMMGKDLNDYNKTIAAKIAGVSQSDIRAYDLYFRNEEHAFDNINEFLNFLVKTFNLQGLTLQVFITKWMYQYGTGTEYASELYTSFLVLMANAYSGSYIVQQKQIERASKSEMIKLCLEIEKVGASVFNGGTFGEAVEIHDKNTRELSEAVKLRNMQDKFLSIDESDFHVADAAKDIANNAIKFCNEARLTDKLNPFAEKVMLTGIKSAYNSCHDTITNEEYQIYENGTMLDVAKVFKNQFTDKQRYTIETTLRNDIATLRELVRESELSNEYKSSVSKVISEMLEIQQYI